MTSETHTTDDETTEERGDEWRPAAVGLGELVTRAADRVITPIEEMHNVITDETFRWLGAPAKPVHVITRASTASAYRSVRAAGALLGHGVDRWAANRPGSPSVTAAVAGIDAVWGDVVPAESHEASDAEQGDSPQLTIRDRTGASVSFSADAVATAHPDATPRLVVLIHGLGNTEGRWLKTPEGPEEVGLVEQLVEHGLTPVLVRYRTSRPIAASGTQLAEAIEKLVTHWPVEVEEVAIVGYSMGGLVARSALAVARRRDLAWARLARQSVSVGAPVMGSYVEKGAELAARALRIAPQTRPLGDFIDSRSEGIKDLRSAPSEGSGDESTPADEHPEVVHHMIAGTVTSSTSNPMGWLVGDLVVRPPSGIGRRWIPGLGGPTHEADDARIVGGVTHFSLLDDPAVQHQIVEWLSA